MLLVRAQKGDLAALSQLLAANYSFLLKYLVKVTLHPQLAEDIAQETMLKAVENIRTFNKRSKFSTWLITIATRLFIDNRRRTARERVLMEAEGGSQETGRSLRYRLTGAGGEWSEVLDALGRLSEELRLAVVLKHYYGYTQKEIAEMVGVPEGTVKSRIHTGLQMLRKELMEDEAQLPPSS